MLLKQKLFVKLFIYVESRKFKAQLTAKSCFQLRIQKAILYFNMLLKISERCQCPGHFVQNSPYLGIHPHDE